MSFVLAEPPTMMAAAADIEGIGSVLTPTEFALQWTTTHQPQAA